MRSTVELENRGVWVGVGSEGKGENRDGADSEATSSC